MTSLKRITLICAAFGILVLPAPCVDLPKDVNEKLDAIIAQAYKTAAKKFPCRIRAGGKAHMLHWQAVDRCLSDAVAAVDWDSLNKQLLDLRTSATSVSRDEFSAAVESALSAHALTFEQVFRVGNENARIPLTNSVLKYLSADSLQDFPVFDREGTLVGSFTGVYSYERSGGLASANAYKLALFQYKDPNGNVQTASDKLLLDSYGVPWKPAMKQRGFRLTSERLEFGR